LPGVNCAARKRTTVRNKDADRSDETTRCDERKPLKALDA
jgi:hypothetical protein